MTDVILFEKTETNFNHEGLGVLIDFTEDLEVTEGIGGFFELNFTYSLDGHLGTKLEKENYIQTIVNEQQEQPLVFRIYECEPDYTERIVYIRARLKQIDDMMNAVHKATTLPLSDINSLIIAIQNRSFPKLNYRVGGSVQNTIKIERDDDSVFNYLFDEKGLITLNKVTPTFTPEGITIGVNRGKVNAGIITEENLLNHFSITENRNDMVTAIIPFTTTKRDEIVANADDRRRTFRETIEEKVYGDMVVSPKISQQGYPLIVKFMEFRNEVVREWEEENRTMHEYKYSNVEQLNSEAAKFFINNPGVDDYFFESKIETLGLHIDEYKQLSSLGLYDEIEVYLQEYNVNVKLQVSEVTYNQALKMTTALKFKSFESGFSYASNRINASALSEAQWRDKNTQERISQIIQDYITKDNGTNLWFRSELPPIEKSVEGDIVFLETEKGISIWIFKDGAWFEELPLNLKRIIEDKFTEVTNQVSALEQNLTESEERHTKALEDFRKEMDEMGYQPQDFDQLKSEMEAVRETSRVNAEMIGNDGITRYNKNLLKGAFDRKIGFNDGKLTLEANDGGFKRGETYTISFEAVCELLEKAALHFNFDPTTVRRVVITLTPTIAKLPTVSSAGETVHVYLGEYEMNVVSDWYQTQSSRWTITGDQTVTIDLDYREIADGNLERTIQGIWAEEPEIILDGGGVEW